MDNQALYTAFMKAADHIEKHPEQFDFDSIIVPSDASCGSPGCALGWTAYFLGLPWDQSLKKGHFIPGIKDSWFYEQMDEMTSKSDQSWGPWIKDPVLCAKGIRLVAQKHFGPPKLDPVLEKMLKGMDQILTESLTT